MKIAVVGAGAIGGYLGARLSAAGEEVTFIARGANLAAIKANGMKLIGENGAEIRTTSARAVEKTPDAGPHDTVLLTVKAHQVAALAPELRHLCHAQTTIVTMQNGIPWGTSRSTAASTTASRCVAPIRMAALPGASTPIGSSGAWSTRRRI